MTRSSIDGARARSRFTALAVVLIALGSILPYLNALSADFTFDDIDVIRDNPAVQVYPAHRLLNYVHQIGSLYRPVTMLTYSANARLSQDPFGYHLVNVVLHTLVALAVFFLALRILHSRVAAVAAALLFAAHPIHTEAVTNIVGRAELLAALGVVAALLAFARARERSGRHRILWDVLSVAAFATALLAKESALTGLGLLAALHWSIDRHASLRQRLAALAPYAAVGFAYLLLRFAVVGALGLPETPAALDNPLAHVDLWSRLRTAIIVLWDYVGLLALPLHLSADYSFDQVPVAHSWLDARFLIAAALLAGLAGVLVAAMRRAPVLAVAALFMLVPLAPTANLLFPIGTIKAERLLYLPSVGWVLGCGWLAARAATQRSAGWLVALALLTAAYGGRTWLRNRDWRDNGTLFAATLLDAPDSAKAHFNAGVVLEKSDQFDEALIQYRQALEIYPRYADAARGIGNTDEKKGMEGAALHWYEDALQRDPALVRAHLQIGELRERRGEYDAAKAAYLTGLATEPDNPVLLARLGSILLVEGDRWRAEMVFERLAHLDTLDPDEHQLVARARYEIEVALR